MLRTTKNMKEKYERIQNYLFSLIPEKWEEIYLYASVVPKNKKTKENNNLQKGELFFYYVPKGILKRRAINVYEVPRRFNINEEQYLKMVDELYKNIKSLQKDFYDTDQEIWTNLTISIANFKFKVEYKYDELPLNEKEIFERNVIWKYKYLKIGGDNREEHRILNDYYTNMKPLKKEVYETGIYLKTENNTVTFDKDEKFVMYERVDITNMLDKTKNKFHSVKTKDINKGLEKEKEHRSKNQILG